MAKGSRTADAAEGKIKVNVHVRTELVNSEVSETIEVDADDWREMTPEERDALCYETVAGLIEWGCKEAKEAANG